MAKRIVYGGTVNDVGPDGPDGLREVYDKQSLIDAILARQRSVIGYTGNASAPLVPDKEAYGSPMEPFASGALAQELRDGKPNLVDVPASNDPHYASHTRAYEFLNGAAKADPVLALGADPRKFSLTPDTIQPAWGGNFDREAGSGIATGGFGSLEKTLAHEATHAGYSEMTRWADAQGMTALDDVRGQLPPELRRGFFGWSPAEEEGKVRMRGASLGTEVERDGYAIPQTKGPYWQDQKMAEDYLAALVASTKKRSGPR